jgi:hypothetical protein
MAFLPSPPQYSAIIPLPSSYNETDGRYFERPKP